MLRAAADMWAAYEQHVDWEPRPRLEARVAELVPALMLARVDGKSPVEYLSVSARDRVRGLALALIDTPETQIRDVLSAIKAGDDDG